VPSPMRSESSEQDAAASRSAVMTANAATTGRREGGRRTGPW
jgi:hypothetical protein